jgi:hypothetical protein
MLAVALVASACTLPADDAGEIPVTEIFIDGAADTHDFAECITEDDCEYYPEQTYSQCIAACEAGVAAMEVFCRFILSPVVSQACWKAAYAGPAACVNFCKWYFTP